MNPRKMSSSKTLAAGVALTGLALAAGLFLVRANFGQNKNPLVDQANAGPPAFLKGLPSDWTEQYLVYPETTDPGMLAKAQHDPRWWLQQIKRHSGQGGNALNNRGIEPPNAAQFPSDGLFASILPPLLAKPL